MKTKKPHKKRAKYWVPRFKTSDGWYLMTRGGKSRVTTGVKHATRFARYGVAMIVRSSNPNFTPEAVR